MPSDEEIIDLSRYPRRYNGHAASPFRYPGGKGFLTPFLEEQILKRFKGTAPSIAEPYCGGAGASLNLLLDNVVSNVYLNDADYRIYSAWKALLTETSRFIEKIEEVKVNLETWEKSLEIIYDSKEGQYDFSLGFAVFFINRTSRSGVVLGSGPIGGYGQEGAWKIDARFNKKALKSRIEKLAKFKRNIQLHCMDGVDFCKHLRNLHNENNILLFVDPPYVKAGGRLYYNGMNLAKHDALASWLTDGKTKHWILTYDDHPLVRENYESISANKVQVRYTLSKRRIENELLFMSRLHDF